MKRRILRIGAGVLATLLAIVALFLALTWAPDRPVDALKPRWAPAPSRFIEISGMNVHVRSEGAGPTIVLLHGTSASLHTWEGWTTALRANYRVVRVDLPGFGLTGPTPDGRYEIEVYTRFMAALLDKLAITECVLAGNSFGGRVAWETAVAYPDRVSKLVLVDAAGYPNPTAQMPLGFRLARVPVLNRLLGSSLPRSIVEKSLRNVYGDPSKVTPELVDLYFDLAVRAGNREALVKRFEQAPSGAGEERIRSLSVPTLILWGSLDRLIPPEHGARFQKDIKGSELVTFEGLGHVPHEEDPAKTVAPVLAFLKQ